jgi:AraC-like DNA-binding protein
MSRFSTPEAELSGCFSLTARRGIHLYRPRGEERSRWRTLFEDAEAAVGDEGFASRLLADTCVLQLLVALNRAVRAAPEEADPASYRFDPKMEEITRYILAHLGEELSIDRLAGAFFLSRYYLMHRFKEVYGCSVHQYIRQKRLQKAAEAIRRDIPVLKAAEDAGFGDYSVFLRAFRAAYGKSPREWK